MIRFQANHYKKVLTEEIGLETHRRILYEFESNNPWWSSDINDTGYNGYNIMDYMYNHRQSTGGLSEALKRRGLKVAGGLRFICSTLQSRLLAPFATYLLPMIYSVEILDNAKKIGQVSANIYLNPYDDKDVFVQLGPHNEKLKFNFLLGIYIISDDDMSTGLCINLKTNTSNGHFVIKTDHLSMIYWDS